MQVRETRELVLNIIRQRQARATEAEFDFLSMYLGATDKNGECFSDEELLDELITLIVAGYETSAGTLNWAWWLLAVNPAAEDELLAEARNLLPSPEHVTQEALTEMSYTQQVLEETLRLYPPVWLFTRRSIAEDSLERFDVPEGTDIYLSPYLLHRSAKYWPDPETFRPERFGPEAPYKKGERPYFPFSLGPAPLPRRVLLVPGDEGAPRLAHPALSYDTGE